MSERTCVDCGGHFAGLTVEGTCVSCDGKRYLRDHRPRTAMEASMFLSERDELIRYACAALWIADDQARRHDANMAADCTPRIAWSIAERMLAERKRRGL